ncbi:MAG: heme biosynthesis protein HemY, partial [Alphaproteobacteria bacterium]|nr:heme biosynthesis protein HemY [Alphaproteobacteria bacterium]
TLALTRGLVAVAAGDPREARRHAMRAQQLLEGSPLAQLLEAQTAQLEGDEAAVETHYRAMLNSPETAFLGLRGLFMQALKRGDHKAALSLAERAYGMRSKTPWALHALFDLKTRMRNWPGAAEALNAQTRAKIIDAGVAKRRRAVLLASEAQERLAGGDQAGALSLSLEALSLAPGLMPAAAMAAKLLAGEGRAWRAADVIEAAWSHAPHPDLAALYAALKPDEGVAARAKRFAGLIDLNPEHPESRLLAAAQAVATKDFGKARAAIAPLLSPAPTACVCVTMADIEQAESGDAQKAREWMARSLRARRDTYWFCAHCGKPSAVWMAVCEGCQSFDTLGWKVPAEPVLAKAGEGVELDLDKLLYREAPVMGGEPSSTPSAPVARPVPAIRPVPATRPEIIAPAPVLPRQPDDPGPEVGHDDYGALKTTRGTQAW